MQALETHSHEHYLFFMHFRVVTQPLPSVGRARSPFGKLGRLTKKSNTFVYLALNPFQILSLDDDHFSQLERLTVVLYDKTSPWTSVNEARRELFCHKNCTREKLLPTKDALLQYVQRAVYQAGIWTSSTQNQLLIPLPHNLAWTKVSGSWVPVWTTIPEISKACVKPIKCSCKGDCSNKCSKCSKANLVCSPLCKSKYSS